MILHYKGPKGDQIIIYSVAFHQLIQRRGSLESLTQCPFQIEHKLRLKLKPRNYIL